MGRTFAAVVLVLSVFAAPLRAEERSPAAPSDPASSAIVAPSPAVAAAWKREMAKPSPTLRALVVSYGVAQGLDMASTVIARNRGAAEANPVMQGGYLKGLAIKSAMGVATMAAVRAMGTKNRKAAIVTMIALNAATATVAAHNMRLAHALAR